MRGTDFCTNRTGQSRHVRANGLVLVSSHKVVGFFGFGLCVSRVCKDVEMEMSSYLDEARHLRQKSVIPDLCFSDSCFQPIIEDHMI